MKDFPNEGYLGELREQRKAWLHKPVLRSLYAHWYAECASCFAPLTPVVEIGSGCGNFKEFYGDVVCTDLVRGGEWIDLVMDAQELPLAAGRVGNLFVFDVLHHLRRPLDFLLQAVAALKPGGRLILCEPALSTWSKFVYGRFHHEPMDISWDPFAPEETSARADSVMEFANEAIPEIIFWRKRERTMRMLAGSTLVRAHKFGFLLYPLTGGFNYRSRVPQFAFPFLQKIEDVALRPFADRFTGMRMLVVLEKAPNSSHQ